MEYPGPAWKMPTNLYGIYHCWVYSEQTPDNGETNSPKQWLYINYQRDALIIIYS